MILILLGYLSKELYTLISLFILFLIKTRFILTFNIYQNPLKSIIYDF